jgi:hypothetical protein
MQPANLPIGIGKRGKEVVISEVAALCVQAEHARINRWQIDRVIPVLIVAISLRFRNKLVKHVSDFLLRPESLEIPLTEGEGVVVSQTNKYFLRSKRLVHGVNYG